MLGGSGVQIRRSGLFWPARRFPVLSLLKSLLSLSGGFGKLLPKAAESRQPVGEVTQFCDLLSVQSRRNLLARDASDSAIVVQYSVYGHTIIPGFDRPVLSSPHLLGGDICQFTTLSLTFQVVCEVPDQGLQCISWRHLPYALRVIKPLLIPSRQ